jgi:hypothetical protein
MKEFLGLGIWDEIHSSHYIQKRWKILFVTAMPRYSPLPS